MTIRNFRRRISALSLLLLLMVFFQNCQPAMRFTTLDAGAVVAGIGGGNGDGYGGKPGGDFYRFTPDFTCEDKEAPVSMLAITESKTTYTENKRLMCGAVKTDLDSSLIDTSVYQNDIVGYLEGIFESKDAAPTSIPANLVEVWCRDSNDRSGIETITHYDRSSQLAVTRIHSAGPGTSVSTIPDFNVSRVISPMLVTVTNGPDFTLKVYRDRPAAQMGLFQGSLEATVGGQKIKRETSCRLGGSLDAKVWPARQIVDMNITSLKVSPDRQSFGYLSNTGSPVTNLYSGTTLGTGQFKVNAPNTTAYSIFDFSPDSNSLIYWANQGSMTAPELYKVGRNGADPLQLEHSAVSDNINNAKNGVFQFSPDGSKVIYWDDPMAAQHTTNETLNSVSLSGGSPIVLSPPIQNFGNYHAFAVSPSLNKVAFFMGTNSDLQNPNILFISNLDGTGLFQVTIPYPSDGWAVTADPMDTPVQWSGQSPFVFVRSLRTSGGKTDILFSAIAADGSGVVSAPLNWLRVSSNLAGHIVLLASRDNPPAHKLMDLTTGHFLDLPLIQPKFFSKDGASLVATESSTLVSIDVVSGTKTALCPQAAPAISNLQDLGAGRWLITSWNEISGILGFYQSTSGQCVLKNSIPLSRPTLNNVILTPDLQKAVVSVTISLEGQNHYELFYVPLKGKMPYKIN